MELSKRDKLYNAILETVKKAWCRDGDWLSPRRIDRS